MAAKIFALPRFEGEKVRQLPNGPLAFHEALQILADRSTSWRDFIDDQLQNGETLISAETRRDHRVIDGAALQAMGEELQDISKHLNALAKMLKETD